MPEFVSHYARAFADVVTSAKLDSAAIDRELNDFVATWDGSRGLREVFESSAITIEQKVAILDKMNAKLGMKQELRNFIAVLIGNDRIAHIGEVVKAYRAELEKRQGVHEAEILTARELGEQERAELLAGVGKLAGGTVKATFKLDKSILGGTIVRIGSTVYDGSVKGRLERLRETLSSS